MATVVKSNTVNNQTPAPIPGDMAAIMVVETINLAAGEVAANVVVALATLPAGCVPISYVLAADDLDNVSNTTTMDLGVLNNSVSASASTSNVNPANVSTATQVSTATADGGGKWVVASTLAQAGGILLSTASKAAFDLVKGVTAKDYDRVVGVVFPAGSSGQAGKLRLELTYASAR